MAFDRFGQPVCSLRRLLGPQDLGRKVKKDKKTRRQEDKNFKVRKKEHEGRKVTM